MTEEATMNRTWMSVALATLLLACSGGDPDDSVLPGVQAVVFVKRAFITEGGGHNVTGGNGQTIDYLRYEPGGGLYVLSPPTPDGTLTNLTEEFEGQDSFTLQIDQASSREIAAWLNAIAAEFN